MELEEKITHILQQRSPIKAREIAQELHETKTAINSKLYQMAQSGRCHKSEHNFWLVSSQEENTSHQPSTTQESNLSESRTYSEDLPEEGHITSQEIKRVEGLNGFIAGYDPGGNDKNGFATLQIKNGIPRSISIRTLNNSTLSH